MSRSADLFDGGPPRARTSEYPGYSWDVCGFLFGAITALRLGRARRLELGTSNVTGPNLDRIEKSVTRSSGCGHGAAGAGCEHATGVELTSFVGTGPSGKSEIVGRWCNGTGQTIFLSGCTTVQGEYLEAGGVWQSYGGFMQCTWEGYARELGAGAC